MDRRDRGGVFEDVAGFPRGIERIYGHRLRAGGMDGEHRDRHVDGIPHDQRNPFTSRAKLLKAPGKPADASHIIAVGQIGRAKTQCDCIRATGRCVRQHMDDGIVYRGQIVRAGHPARIRQS